jgi:hypothetical protein
MVNNGDYSFLRDTVLPTIGIQKWNDKRLHVDENVRQMFLESMEATVKQLKNHPCICYWTIFNEGWGQFDSDSVYEILKKLDDTRFIDSTSGWFRRKKTDVDSRHVYFRKVRLKAGDKPLVLSEFGGKTYHVEGHVFNPDKSYGYGTCKTREALEDAVTRLYLDEVVPCVKQGLCASIYTQVSDVEDEINGLLTYDRKVEKLTPEAMRLEVQRAFKRRMAKERKALERRELNPAVTAQPSSRTIRYDNFRSAMAEEGVLRLLLRDESIFPSLSPLQESDFSSPLLGKIYTALWQRRQNGMSGSIAFLSGELNADEMSHLTTLLQKPESTAGAQQALTDYIRIIREERDKRLGAAGKDPLAAAMDKFKEKKGYGGKRND